MTRATVEKSERSLCVLVVEDEFFIALELETTLIDAGFRVLGPVGTVADALDVIEDDRPDAAVLDVNLGRERVTPVAIHLNQIGVPFVLASAMSAAELARDCSLADAPNVGKPTRRSDLVLAVKQLFTA
ncbi:UNVERIFIED_ORG: DNA-binding response OmpR family regulator [Shinella zoogloeoides]|nr:DNA-binding response OmpR family regulator [Shinella zoogloeoides]